jgi:hypothetical protein
MKGMIMGSLLGYKEYLDVAYRRSVFEQALASQQPWELRLHGQRVIRARVVENSTYELKLAITDQGEEVLPKIQVKLLYPAERSAAVRPLIKVDKKVQALGLSPLVTWKERHFVKNKTLFPLMKEAQVVFFTLLEGEIIRGLIAEFSQYDITVNLKGGVPVVLLRHSIYDLRNKEGRCLLKAFQDEHRDWEKSPLFVS